MAFKQKLGEQFYLFRKASYAKQLLIESHGGYTPFDKVKTMPNVSLVWFGPHGMTNSGGYFFDDIMGKVGYSVKVARYYEVTTGWPNYDYIIGKFDTNAAASYGDIDGYIDNRTLSIDVVTVRNRFGKFQPRLSDLLAELNKHNLHYNYILCNFCRDKTTNPYDAKNDWDVHSNPKGNLLTTLRNWDNTNV
jgi:hypothetical protein